MGFQIIFNDSPINISDLDKEAAAFWNKQVHATQYADPTPLFINDIGLQGIELTRAMMKYELNTLGNWFDIIGWNIHHPQTKYTSGWNNVKCSMWAVQAYSLYRFLYNTEALNQHIEAIRQYLKPYYDLIDHWESKGYIPRQTQD